jgi:hypothetical protein
MDGDLNIKQIMEGRGEHLRNPPPTSNQINLFGSLFLNEEEVTTRHVWGTLESAYPQAFIENEENDEYIRNLEKAHIRCDALIALLPDSSAAAPPKQTYREYIASLPAPRPRLPSPKRKPADPTKLAAAQARVVAQHQQRKAVAMAAAAAAAAAVVAKKKNKQASSITTTTKKKAKVAPTIALKATKATTATKVTKTTTAAPKKKKTTTLTTTAMATAKRVSKIEKLRPKPLTVATSTIPPLRAAASKTEHLPPPSSLPPSSLPAAGKSKFVVVPRTAEKKDEKASAAKGGFGSVKHPKTPTIEAMCK